MWWDAFTWTHTAGWAVRRCYELCVHYSRSLAIALLDHFHALYTEFRDANTLFDCTYSADKILNFWKCTITIYVSILIKWENFEFKRIHFSIRHFHKNNGFYVYRTQNWFKWVPHNFRTKIKLRAFLAVLRWIHKEKPKYSNHHTQVTSSNCMFDLVIRSRNPSWNVRLFCCGERISRQQTGKTRKMSAKRKKVCVCVCVPPFFVPLCEFVFMWLRNSQTCVVW